MRGGETRNERGKVVSMTLLHLVPQRLDVPRAEQHLYVALRPVRVELELRYIMLHRPNLMKHYVVRSHVA